MVFGQKTVRNAPGKGGRLPGHYYFMRVVPWWRILRRTCGRFRHIASLLNKNFQAFGYLYFSIFTGIRIVHLKTGIFCEKLVEV